MPRLQDKPTLRACCEAETREYVLHRQFGGMGIDSLVVDPTRILAKSEDRIKRDRSDALKLSRYLYAGELAALWGLHEAHKAVVARRTQ